MVFRSLYFPVGLLLLSAVVGVIPSVVVTVSGLLLIPTCHPKPAQRNRRLSLPQLSTRDFQHLHRHGDMIHTQPSSSSSSSNDLAVNNDRRVTVEHEIYSSSSSCLGRIRGGGAIDGGAAGGARTATSAVPAVSKWMPLALICATSYALYNLCIKKASSTKPIPMDPLLGGVILQLVAAAMGTGLYVFRGLSTTAATTTSATAITAMKNGVLWSVAAGLSVGMAEILSFVISGMNVKASQSIPTVIGGSVVIGTILGAVWLREQLTLRGWFGILLISIGIAIVGIDPGTVAAH